MKSITFLVIVLAIFTQLTKAQKPILVKDDSLSFGKTYLPAITVTIPEVKYETTLKSWIKELQSGTKSKLVTENNEMTIFGARIKDITPNPVNVYSKMTALDSSVSLTVSFELKKDKYIDRTNETGLDKAKKYLKDFAKNGYTDVAKDQADAEESKLHDLEKQLSSLEKDKSKLQKTIESDNNTIFTENQNLTVQKNELESVSAEIIDQNKQLSSPEGDAVKKEKNDYINTLEKRKKKAQSGIESAQNRIDKANNEIDKTNAEIPRNEKLQEQVNQKIQAQQTVYQKYADKLKTIKSY